MNREETVKYRHAKKGEGLRGIVFGYASGYCSKFYDYKPGIALLGWQMPIVLHIPYGKAIVNQAANLAARAVPDRPAISALSISLIIEG